MPNKQNPFDDESWVDKAQRLLGARDMQTVFEEAKRDMQTVFEEAKRAAIEKEMAARLAAQQQRDFWEAQQDQRAVPFLPQFPQGPGPSVDGYTSQLRSVQARQQRLATARLLGSNGQRADAAAEAVRQDLGRLLKQAIEVGLISEEQAVAMIVAGGVNNEPMGPADAVTQVQAALAQAVASGALSEARSRQMSLALVSASEPGVPMDVRASPDLRDPLGQGATRPASLRLPADGLPDPRDPLDRDALLALALRSQPEPGKYVEEPDLQVLVRSLPGLLAEIDRLEDLVYDALTLRPCHNTEHDEWHRDAAIPCADQASSAVLALLDRLGVPPTGLPRRAHLGADGRRARCCAQDGRIGTWLLYGQTLDPQASFSGDR